MANATLASFGPEFGQTLPPHISLTTGHTSTLVGTEWEWMDRLADRIKDLYIRPGEMKEAPPPQKTGSGTR